VHQENEASQSTFAIMNLHQHDDHNKEEHRNEYEQQPASASSLSSRSNGDLHLQTQQHIIQHHDDSRRKKASDLIICLNNATLVLTEIATAFVCWSASVRFSVGFLLRGPSPKLQAGQHCSKTISEHMAYRSQGTVYMSTLP